MALAKNKKESLHMSQNPVDTARAILEKIETIDEIQKPVLDSETYNKDATGKGDEVHDQADHGDDAHRSAVDFRRRPDTADGLAERFAELVDRYTVSDYTETPAEALLPLADGALAPDFTGRHLMTGDSVGLADLGQRVTVLDFWYKDCFPCIKAIPALNALRTKYDRDEVAIVGINPIDTDSLGRAQLPAFFKSNPVTYDVILTHRKQASEYKVQGYPTFFLLDRDGRIVHSRVGYSEEGKLKLDSLIQVLLSDG
jgi:thiol-disulfide isomerase/thioredoxin